MKNLMNLKGVKTRNKDEQKSISVAAKPCNWYYCPLGCDRNGVCISVGGHL